MKLLRTGYLKLVPESDELQFKADAREKYGYTPRPKISASKALEQDNEDVLCREFYAGTETFTSKPRPLENCD